MLTVRSRLPRLALALAVVLIAAVAAFFAGAASRTEPVGAAAAAKAPLYVSLISDTGHRTEMGIGFAQKQQKLGHPITIWLNDRGVRVGSTKYATKYRAQQKMLRELIADGANVYACPMCTKYYKIDPKTYLKGIELSSPEKLEAKLYQGATLTW